MIYLRNELEDFTGPWIKSGIDTFRWIIDVRNYRDAHPDHPQKMLAKEILKYVPVGTRQLYFDYATSYEWDRYSLNALISFAKYTYQPPATIDPLLEMIKKIIIRRNENPIRVYSKIQCCFKQIEQIIDILNDDYDEGDEREIPV